MGSASPGLSPGPPGRLLLPPDSALRTGLEKAAVAGTGPERRDWSPSPPATPEQGLPTFYLSYFDMLYPEDSSWAAKVEGLLGRQHARRKRAERHRAPQESSPVNLLCHRCSFSMNVVIISNVGNQVLYIQTKFVYNQTHTTPNRRIAA